MAIVVRYFSTAAAGAGDGTTWADRAALFTAGNWSSVITGFDFSGSDSLEARIGTGTYTCTSGLASASFANPPTTDNPLILHGATSDGSRATPDFAWSSDKPAGSSFDFPEIQASLASNTRTVTDNIISRCLRFVQSSSSNAGVIGGQLIDWCYVEMTAANTGTAAVGSIGRVTNCILRCSGASYAAVYLAGNLVVEGANVRLEGNASASSGDRRGLRLTTSTANSRIVLSRFVAVNNVGDGFSDAIVTSTVGITYDRCMSIDNTGSGFLLAGGASVRRLVGCVATGNGAYGVTTGSAYVYVSNCRFRDNTSGNVNGLVNWPADLDLYTTDDADADDYVAPGSDNFQIKATAGFADRQIGVSQEESAGGGGGTRVYAG